VRPKGRTALYERIAFTDIKKGGHLAAFLVGGFINGVPCPAGRKAASANRQHQYSGAVQQDRLAYASAMKTTTLPDIQPS
jgi:hypothetical protein